MHAERDWLAKHVFPELRQRCARRGLDFVDVDLRWGVTEEEAEKGAVLDICLEEIEKSRPIFIGILGERYGWVPLPREIEQDYFDRAIRSLFNAEERDIFNHAYSLSEADRRYFLKSGALKADEEETLRHALERTGYRSYAVTPPPSTPDRDHEPHYAYLAKEPFGHSVTALEMLHGVLRNPAMKEQGFFYFRDPLFMKDVPEARRPEMEAESSTAKEKLASLKTKIREIYADCPGNVTEGYPCRYSGIKIYWPEVKAVLGSELTPTDVAALEQACGENYLVKPEAFAALTASQQAVVDRFGVVYLDGLEEFGAEILEAIWQAISTQYPDEKREAAPLASQLAAHLNFMRDRAALFIGRKQEREALASYADDEEPRPIVVTGPGGIGKSALLASFTLAYGNTHQEATVLPFFIGATPRSNNMGMIIEDLIHALAARFQIPLPEKLDLAPEKLSETLYPFLIEAGKKGRVLVLIDALDQLAAFDKPEHLRWLPGRLPKNIRLVLSALSSPVLENLRRRKLSEIVVPALPPGERRAMVTEYLGRYGKKLSVFQGKDQMATLLAKGESSIPLYLKAACEELRLYPRFEEVTARIVNLPETVPELLFQMLTRLEADFGRTLVRDAVCLLRVSRQGLTEMELRRLLRTEGEELLPSGYWARLFRGFSGFLKGGGGEDGESRVGFYHRQLGEAVTARYLQDATSSKPYLDRLADEGFAVVQAFLQTGRTPPRFSALETGIYLLQAQRPDDLYALMEKVFTAGNQHWPSLETIPDQTFDYGVFKGSDSEGGELRAVLERLAVDVPNLRLSTFCHNKSQIFQVLGVSRWALHLCQAMNATMEELVASEPDNTGFLRDLAASFNNLGLIYKDLGDSHQAIAFSEKCLRISEKLVIIEPDNTGFLRDLAAISSNLALIYRDIGDGPQTITFSEKSVRVVGKLVIIEPKNTGFLRDLAVNLNNLGLIYNNLDDSHQAIAFSEESVRVLEILVNIEPGCTAFRRELAVSLNTLAMIYKDLDECPKAIAFSEKSLQISEELMTRVPDRTDFINDFAGSLNTLGLIYKDLGDSPMAITFYEKSLEIMKELVDCEPERTDFLIGLASSFNNLGLIYTDLNDSPKALAFYEKSLPILEELVARCHDRTDFCNIQAGSFNHLGLIYKNLGDISKAFVFFEKSVQIRRKLVVREPKRIDFSNDLVASLGALGLILNDSPKALAFYEESLPILEELVARYPDHTDFCNIQAVNLNTLGLIYKNLGDAPKAITFHEKSLQLMEELVAREPDSTGFRHSLAVSFYSLGQIYQDLGDTAKALAFSEKTLQVMNELVAREPDNTNFRSELAGSFNNLGLIYQDLGDTAKAIVFSEKSLQVMEKLVALDPDRTDFLVQYANSHWNGYLACSPEEKKHRLTKAKGILQPLIDKGVAHGQLNQLWQLVNDALNKIFVADQI
jgi:tetratricopeptide (TPR) repeat protein